MTNFQPSLISRYFSRIINFSIRRIKIFPSFLLLVPLFCLHIPIILFQLSKSIKTIRSSKNIVIMSGLGFGNSITGIDIMRRMYKNDSPLFIYVLFGYHNPYVQTLWKGTPVLSLKSVMNKSFSESKLFSFACFLNLIFIRKLIFLFIKRMTDSKVLDVKDMYHESLKVIPRENSSINNYINFRPKNYGFIFVPWYYLIKNVKVRRAELPKRYRDNLMEKIISFTRGLGVQTTDRFCSLYIRAKGENSKNVTSKVRDGGPIEFFLPSIKRLIKKGYTILIIGDRNIDKKYIKEFNHRLVSAEFLQVDINQFMLFAATEADIFIGNSGGGAILPTANEIPTLIIDAFPYGVGLTNASMHFKTVKNANGELVPYSILFSQYPYDYNIKEHRICNNTPQEIDFAVKHFLEDLSNPESNIKDQKSMDSLPEDLLIKHSNTKISRAWLNLYKKPE